MQVAAACRPRATLRMAIPRRPATPLAARAHLSVRCAASAAGKPPVTGPILQLAGAAVGLVQRAASAVRLAAAEAARQTAEQNVNDQIRQSVKQMRMLAVVAPFAAVTGSTDTFLVITRASALPMHAPAEDRAALLLLRIATCHCNCQSKQRLRCAQILESNALAARLTPYPAATNLAACSCTPPPTPPPHHHHPTTTHTHTPQRTPFPTPPPAGSGLLHQALPAAALCARAAVLVPHVPVVGRAALHGPAPGEAGWRWRVGQRTAADAGPAGPQSPAVPCGNARRTHMRCRLAANCRRPPAALLPPARSPTPTSSSSAAWCRRCWAPSTSRRCSASSSCRQGGVGGAPRLCMGLAGCCRGAGQRRVSGVRAPASRGG